jgi:hypothetical protein
VTGPPVYSECLVGYRSWYVGLGASLWPAGWVPTATGGGARVHRPWSAGPNTAACPVHPHLAPDWHCTCGLHACFEVPAPAHGYVTGAIAAWGLVQVHLDGFRAQHAQITALVAAPGCIDTDAIAARYGVPVVPEGFLELEAARHGKPIAPEAVHGDAAPRPQGEG